MSRPWTISKKEFTNLSEVSILNSSGELICTCVGPLAEKHAALIVARSNGQMHSAAPELLAALKRAVHVEKARLEDAINEGAPEHEIAALTDNLSAYASAVAKATK